MFKRVILSLLTIFICSAVFLFFYTLIPSNRSLDIPCAFCDQNILNNQKFYEDDLVIALYTHKPIVQSHFLIIPKRHVERLDSLLSEEIAHIHQVINKVREASQNVFQTSSYFIYQKNGKEAWQTVPHVHFHFIGKVSQDDSFLRFLIKMILAHFQRPISVKEMKNVTEKMKDAMQISIPYERKNKPQCI